MRKLICLSVIIMIATSPISAVAKPPAATTADPTVVMRAAPVAYPIIDRNVSANQNVIDNTMDVAAEDNVKLIIMQEVCGVQYTALKIAHPNWSWTAYDETDRFNECAVAGDSLNNVVAWRGGTGGTDFSQEFTNQKKVDGVKVSHYGIACLKYNSMYMACSVHTISGGGSDAIATLQAQEVKEYVKPIVNNGKMVVIGGDFNMFPNQTGMDYLYSAGGGQFQSTYRAPGDPNTACRCGVATSLNNDYKIDYIFVSRGNFPVNASSSEEQSSVTALSPNNTHVRLSGRPFVILP